MERLVQKSFAPSNLVKCPNCLQIPETLLPLQTQSVTENGATHIPRPVMYEDSCSSKLVGVSNLASTPVSRHISGGSVTNPAWTTVPG